MPPNAAECTQSKDASTLWLEMENAANPELELEITSLLYRSQICHVWMSFSTHGPNPNEAGYVPSSVFHLSGRCVDSFPLWLQRWWYELFQSPSGRFLIRFSPPR